MSLLSPHAAAPSRPQLPSPGVAVSLFNETFEHRAELAAVELGEVRDHALISTLLAGGTAALVLFTGFALTLLLASLVWDSPNRAWWLTGLTAVYLLGAGYTGYSLVRRLRTWHPLEETQSQLKQDYQCLSKLIKAAIR
jgi:uncharacterized membrane protein YqjE